MELNRPASSKTTAKDIFQVKVSSPETEICLGIKQSSTFSNIPEKSVCIFYFQKKYLEKEFFTTAFCRDFAHLLVL